MVVFNTQRLRLKSCDIVQNRAGSKSAFGQKIASVLLFTGKEHEEETELDYFGARYYDADLGLWISPDPARQFYNPYLYAGNNYNPVNGIDPDGNQLISQNYKNDKGEITNMAKQVSESGSALMIR